MNKLTSKIRSIIKNRKKVFVGCLTAGYPDMKSTFELALVLVDSGVDVLELCVPFSDPIADGPTIQYSSDIALKKGANLKGILNLVKRIKKKTGVPIVLMSYINPIIRMGMEKVFRISKESGVDGYIIPDLIMEESAGARKACRKFGISFVPLVAPNTPKKRLISLAKEADSFVYVVSIAGVTGARKGLPDHIVDYLALVKRQVKKPKFLGFGISGPQQVRQVRKYVEGVIVASAIINIIRNSKNKKIRNHKIRNFVKSLKTALN